MVLDFYYTPSSPNCYSPQILAKALGLELNLKFINLRDGETRTPEYLKGRELSPKGSPKPNVMHTIAKLNPAHTIPTLVDNGHSVWESRAILQYLCDAYDTEGRFYPHDARQRSVVNRLLYFDLGTLIKAFIGIFANLRSGKPDDPEARKRLVDALELLEGILTGRKWLLGEQLTIADMSLVVTVARVHFVHPDFSAFPNIRKWVETAKKEMPGYEEIIETGAGLLREFFMQLKSGK